MRKNRKAQVQPSLLTGLLLAGASLSWSSQAQTAVAEALPGAAPAVPAWALQVQPERPQLCAKTVQPALQRIPVGEFRGKVVFRAKVRVSEGRVRNLEIGHKTSHVERKLSRALIASLTDALQRYQCEGEGEFEQTFQFELKD